MFEPKQTVVVVVDGTCNEAPSEGEKNEPQLNPIYLVSLNEKLNSKPDPRGRVAGGAPTIG